MAKDVKPSKEDRVPEGEEAQTTENDNNQETNRENFN